ncbi:unnamed protein product [Paramecium pentaurelia]|uniref:Uncharacterized protein n=1 Tax=Paramecium pentaurelia TaxID=43138 RepID=A0A8S1Y4Q3_9CILI|nr:unnamed protein product [Paramecium pentaurelia]
MKRKNNIINNGKYIFFFEQSKQWLSFVKIIKYFGQAFQEFYQNYTHLLIAYVQLNREEEFETYEEIKNFNQFLVRDFDNQYYLLMRMLETNLILYIQNKGMSILFYLQKDY